MYRPQHFKIDELELCKDLIEAHPLGVLVTPMDGSLEINYLPFLIEKNGDQWNLWTHMAKANPQAQNLHNHFAVVSFQGPDRYISPSWYESQMEVPTWNYCAVQVGGRVEVIEDVDGIEDILQRSVLHFERRNNTSWNYDLPEKFRNSLIRHIVGIKIPIESIQGKFKVSQNRKPQDRQKVQEQLEKSSLHSDQEMLQMMKRITY